MIKSMTGFGKAEATLPHKKITVEIRSLNSRQLDLSVYALFVSDSLCYGITKHYAAVLYSMMTVHI